MIRNRFIPKKVLKETMMGWVFSKTEIEIINACDKETKKGKQRWYLLNVALPLIIILVPFLFWKFLPEQSTIITVIFNGSLSIVGINILASVDGFILKLNNQDSEQKDDSLFELYKKLHSYLMLFLFIGSILYVTQIIYGENLPWPIISMIVIILPISIINSRFIYMMQSVSDTDIFNNVLATNTKSLRTGLRKNES